jgi:hypothetical protein
VAIQGDRFRRRAGPTGRTQPQARRDAAASDEMDGFVLRAGAIPQTAHSSPGPAITRYALAIGHNFQCCRNETKEQAVSLLFVRIDLGYVAGTACSIFLGSSDGKLILHQ